MKDIAAKLLSLILVLGVAIAMAGCSSSESGKEGQPIQKGDYETTPGAEGQPK